MAARPSVFAAVSHTTQSTIPSKIYQYKLVLLGESSVGKSSLVLRFVKGQFQEYQESTIGAAFLTQSVCLENRTIKFEIWDTAGQERYHSLAPMYYRGAQVAIVVFDITNQDSLHKAKTWVKELQRQANSGIIIALAGNKVDLEEKRTVSAHDAESYAQENGLIFFETSAKTGLNVIHLFTKIAEMMSEMDQYSQLRTGINLTSPSSPNPQQGSCCK